MRPEHAGKPEACNYWLALTSRQNGHPFRLASICPPFRKRRVAVESRRRRSAISSAFFPSSWNHIRAGLFSSGDMYRCWVAQIAEAEGSRGRSECRLASVTGKHLRDHERRLWNSILLKNCLTRTSMATHVPREAPAWNK